MSCSLVLVWSLAATSYICGYRSRVNAIKHNSVSYSMKDRAEGFSPIVHIAETDSTNRWLRQAVNTEEYGTSRTNIVVVADYQTSGRGCGTNTWESERGKNLTFSVLLHPARVPASRQFILSMANALALKDTLDNYVSDIKIKWPNDIYWRDKKICGTLIESTLQGSHIKDCIIGTGLNVNQHEFHSDAPNPVSLCQILGYEVNRNELLQQVLDNMAKYMAMVEKGLWDDISTCYRYHLYRLDETHGYRFLDGRMEQCKLLGVTDDGHLELLANNGEVYRMTFKEVQFII